MVNNANNECGFEHEIVSYMYDELGAVERAWFETHLADCGSCTDEFAAVSFSRFSVFEWQRAEFAPLATPEIVIPYETEKAVAASAGWFAGLTEIFAFARSPLAVGAAFAVLLTVGFIGFSLIRSNEVMVASNVNVSPTASEKKIEQPKVADPQVAGVVKDGVESDNEIRPVTTASRDNRPRVARQTITRRAIEIRSTPNPVRQARRAPVLSELGDDDEDSLRLSDMLDGIGG